MQGVAGDLEGRVSLSYSQWSGVVFHSKLLQQIQIVVSVFARKESQRWRLSNQVRSHQIPVNWVEVGPRGGKVEDGRRTVIERGERIPPTSESGNSFVYKRGSKTTH
jgi:hypothetical protein